MRYLFYTAILMIFLLTAFDHPSSITVTGKVVDENSDPVPFATIIEKGTKNGVYTTVEGKFSITVSSEKAILVVNYIGMEQKEVRVIAGNEMTIKLKNKVSKLEDVVVTTALGQERHSTELGYASSNVIVANNAQAKVVNLQNGLTGRVSGLNVSNNQSNTGIKLRGISSLSSNNSNNNDLDREGYDAINENRFFKAKENPLSTFSIDVDAASYSNVRRFLQYNQLPPAGSVRIEEMINYFHYEYPQPAAGDPFSINTEMSVAPWNKQHRLVMIGLQGKKIPMEHLPASNLVFLVDVSGSMDQADKLPLVIESLKLLTDQLRDQDKVSIVVYAGSAGLVLEPTSGNKKQTIKDALQRLSAGGSTAGGAGIQLAYKTARDHFINGGNNRVILCTDGDFNVGTSSDAELEKLIEKERESGVFLSVLGFGTGNYQDAKMQKLADKGNGNHAYIDNILEAKKVFVSEFGGTLFTIAKDVKLQIEFNPAKVQAYRLIGYENRMLNKEDFNNDKKDAGDLGSGHTVTALYEIIPVGVKSSFVENVDSLRYQLSPEMPATAFAGEIMNIKLRYKQPDGQVSKLITHPVQDAPVALNASSDNFRFAAAVAEFGLVLVHSEFRNDASMNDAWKLAKGALGEDKEGYRSEFLKLVRNAGNLMKEKERAQEEEDDLGVR